MEKKKEFVNSLIKRNKLIKILKNAGMARFKKEALNAIEEEIVSKIKKDSKLMARKLMLAGRKTLMKKDVVEVMALKEEKEREFEV